MLKRKFKNDIILVLGFLFIALILFIIFKFDLKEGKIVKVSIDGKIISSYNIHDNIKTNIANGDNQNILVIEGGQAYILEADCPDKICVSHKKISKVGETIVCLPHKLVVEITEE